MPRSLLCYDGSASAQAAISAAARLLDGPAVVATVWEPVPPPGATHPIHAYLSVIGPSAAELDTAAEEEAARVAARGAELARAAGLDAEPRAERSRGRIASTLVAVADELDAGVIVVGGRGISAVGVKLLGSTSNGVLHEAHCPVLVEPATE